MHPRLLPLLAAAAGPSLACVASTRCIPDILPVRTTLVRGDVRQLVVSEFQVLDGCVEIVLDSMVRRSATVDTLDPDRKWAAVGSAALTLHLRSQRPVLDAAATAGCRNLHMRRRVDFAPVVYGPSAFGLQGDLPAPTGVIAVNPDSVYVCVDGSCSRRTAVEVDNRPDPGACLAGALAPISRDSARALLVERLANAPTIVDLRRVAPAVPEPYAGRLACLPPEVVAARSTRATEMVQETRLLAANDNRTPWGSLPVLSSWSDTAIPVDLAKPDRFSAGDYFEKEVMTFSVHPVRAPATLDMPRWWSYTSGVKTYQYGGMEAHGSGCLLIARPRVVGDSLELEGESVRLDNEGCARRGVDVFANDFTRWLLAPDRDDWAGSFRHGANLDNGSSWPVVDDSVVVRGWKFALDGILATVSVSERSRPGQGPEVRVVNGSVAVRSAQPGLASLMSADGRQLESRFLPAGEGTLPLPSGHRGLLLVRTSTGTTRLMVP